MYIVRNKTGWINWNTNPILTVYEGNTVKYWPMSKSIVPSLLDRGQYLRYCPNNQLVNGLLPEFCLFTAIKNLSFLRKFYLFRPFPLKDLTKTLHCFNWRHFHDSRYKYRWILLSIERHSTNENAALTLISSSALLLG